MQDSCYKMAGGGGPPLELSPLTLAEALMEVGRICTLFTCSLGTCHSHSVVACISWVPCFDQKVHESRPRVKRTRSFSLSERPTSESQDSA